MPSLSALAHPEPYHIFAFGALLGGEIFQSFIGGIVAFRALERPQFSKLQQAIFPVYFGMQAVLPVVLVFTYPGQKLVSGARLDSGVAGVLSESNRTSALWPLVTVFLTGLINLAVIEPAVVGIMRQRREQEKRDRKRSYDPGPHSTEMTRLNKAFGRMHGVSSVLNLAALLATLWYGITLSERL